MGIFRAKIGFEKYPCFSFICPRKFLQNKDFQRYSYFNLRMREVRTARNFAIPPVAQAASGSLHNSCNIRLLTYHDFEITHCPYDVYHTRTNQNEVTFPSFRLRDLCALFAIDVVEGKQRYKSPFLANNCITS